MNEVTAHLVERVLPGVPVRQWVLSLPWHLRFALAGEHDLLRAVARAFLRAVSASYRRRAAGSLRERGGETANTGTNQLAPGAVKFVQRFGSARAPNAPAFRERCHALFIDGVHVCRSATGQPEFLPAAELPPEEVARVHGDAMRRIHRALRRGGRADLVRSGDGGSDDTSQSGALEDPPAV